MNNELANVKKFLQAFGFPIAQEPSLDVPQKFKDLKIKLLKEEVGELQDAFEKGDLIGAYDALADIQYVTLGAAVMLGGEEILKMIFDQVHYSNMSKLGDDGKPIHREDGKVMKSSRYYPPDLQPIFDWYQEVLRLRKLKLNPSKIVYGTTDCGEPCMIELPPELVTRVRRFQDVLKNLDEKGIELKDNERAEISISNLECKVWEDPGVVDRRNFFIDVNDGMSSICQSGYDGQHYICSLDFDVMDDITVTDDILYDMTEYQNHEGNNRDGFLSFLESIPNEHRRLIERKAQEHRTKFNSEN